MDGICRQLTGDAEFAILSEGTFNHDTLLGSIGGWLY